MTTLCYVCEHTHTHTHIPTFTSFVGLMEYKPRRTHVQHPVSYRLKGKLIKDKGESDDVDSRGVNYAHMLYC